jgi:hypothetical protein
MTNTTNQPAPTVGSILPGMTHYNIFSSPTLASTVRPFLDAPMPKAR